MLKGLIYTALLSLLLYGCETGSAGAADEQAQRLLDDVRTWKCRLQEIHDSSVVLWDSVTSTLARELPADMPADERRNMLAVRNTGLIKMFQVYPQLDADIRQLVESAGVMDVRYADELRATNDSLEQKEAQVRELLASLEQADPEAHETWSGRFSRISCEKDSIISQ